MIVKGNMILTLKTGQKVLILLADNPSAQEELYHQLVVDAYHFKREVSTEIPDIELISAGYKTSDNQLVWNDDYIPIPKWYSQN
jgi:hypothetical protein